MNPKPMIEATPRAMPRREFLRNVSVPFALPLFGALTPAPGQTAKATRPEPAAGPDGRTVRNTIELRCDSSTPTHGNYFFASVRSDVILPQRKLFLGNRETHSWVGTTPHRGERILPDGLLWPIVVEYEKPDGMTLSGKHPYFDLPTIPAEQGHIKYVACGKNTAGCDLSTTFQDHRKDWDFLQNKLQEILAAARLSARSSDWEKVEAIGAFCVQMRKTKSNNSRWVHPVDFCLHGAYCIGAANALVGFCSLLGIPARTIGYGGHTTGEVLLDGKWRWVENTVATVAASKPPGTTLRKVSFLEHLNDPAGQVTGEELFDYYARFNCVYDKERSDWFEFNHDGYSNWNFVGTNVYRYDPPRGTTGFGSLRELSALYPEQKSVRYRCDKSPKVWLTPFRMPSPGRRTEHLTVDQDHGIRQEFYLPTGRPMKAVKSLIATRQPEFKIWHTMPKNGGDWYYKINDHKVHVRDAGGWDFRTNYDGTGANGFALTIKPEWLLGA